MKRIYCKRYISQKSNFEKTIEEKLNYGEGKCKIQGASERNEIG